MERNGTTLVRIVDPTTLAGTVVPATFVPPVFHKKIVETTVSAIIPYRNDVLPLQWSVNN